MSEPVTFEQWRNERRHELRIQFVRDCELLGVTIGDFDIWLRERYAEEQAKAFQESDAR